MRLGRLLAGAILWAGAIAACERVSPQAIESWKTAPDGAQRLQRVVENEKQPAAMRAQAAAALVEIGELARAEAAVAGIPIEARDAVLLELVPQLRSALGAADSRKAEDARDALFRARHQATSGAAKALIDAVLLPVIEKELRAGKASGVGRFSALQVCQGVGAASVPMLHKLLDDPQVPFAGVGDILEKVGDKAAREKGGASLAKRAAGKPLAKDLALAMGTLGGKEAVDLLEDVVKKERGDPAAAAAAGMVKLPREDALLPFALAHAGDANSDEPVRASMFELVERFFGEAPRKGLVEIIGKSASAGRLDVAYRALQAALKVNSSDGAVPALEAFPPTVALDVKDVKEKIVKPVIEMRFDGRAAAFKALESKSPLALMVAIWYLDDSGFGEDREQLEKLAKDARVVKGFPRELAVGKEAARVAAKLKKQAS